MLSKDIVHQICCGLRLRLPHKVIAQKVKCSICCVRKLAGNKPVRILLWGDAHCGSNVGMTPPAYQTKFTPNPKTEEHRTLNKWANLQKECWDWYVAKVNMLKPIDKLFYLGDGIDGTAHRCGGTDLIQVDRKVQVQMAIESIEVAEADDIVMVYGTPYHVGQSEDFELDIAGHFNCKIGGHEWEEVNGCMFDLKHKQGNCDNPATGLFQQIRDHREWAGLGEQPKADVLIRAHTHRFCIIKMEDCTGITIPALQAYGCLTAGHKILTADLRYVPVETLEVGDKLLSFEAEATQGKKRRWIESEVLANFPRKAVEVYELKLSDSTTLQTTVDHPFLSQYRSNQYEWKTVGELYQQYRKTGRRIKFRRTLPVWDTDTSYRAGYLAGFYDGEGCLCQAEVKPTGWRRFIVSACQNKLSAKQKDNPCYKAVVGFIKNCGFNISNRKKSYKRDNIHVFDILGGITEVLRFLGTIRPKRLLDKLDISKLGQLRATSKKDLWIIDIKPIGEKTVWALGTTSDTYISEGFLSHNTKFGARQCSRKVQFGLVALDVWPDGVIEEHVHIAKLAAHITHKN